MLRRILLLAVAGLAGCSAPSTQPVTARQGSPQRIVSLDYCADQYVMKLVPKDHVLALSSDAGRDFSYLHDRARSYRKTPPRAEDILALHPDLVVRSYGGGPDIESLLKRAGIPVVQIGYANDMDGVRRVLSETAMALGQQARGARVLADFDARLNRLKRASRNRTALYTTPGGVTAGPDTLIDAMLHAAGFANFETRPGWHPLPLERLAYHRPDLIVAARFGGSDINTDRWSAARNPVARGAFARTPHIQIDGATTSCGGWFILDAVEAIAHGRAQ